MTHLLLALLGIVGYFASMAVGMYYNNYFWRLCQDIEVHYKAEKRARRIANACVWTMFGSLLFGIYEMLQAC